MTDNFSDYQRRGSGGTPMPPTLGIPNLNISPRLRNALIMAAIVIVVLIAFTSSASWWVNWWWFGSTGYREILSTRIVSSIILFVVGFLLATLIVGGNLMLALRRTRATRPSGTLAMISGRILLAIIGLFTLLVSWGVGSSVAGNWEQWLFALNRQSFGINDPAFGMDVGFYFFVLPVLLRVVATLITLVILSLMAVSGIYLIRTPMLSGAFRIPAEMRTHLFGLGAVLLVLIGVRYFLNNYLLVYSNRGPVTGVTYTDDTVQTLANYALVVVTVAAAISLIISIRRFNLRTLLVIGSTWLAVLIVLGAALPAIVQRTFVEPSQLRRESPYIADNIEMTRLAFGLEGLEAGALTGQEAPGQTDLDQNQATVDNVRLWDYSAATAAYQQLQAIERFYSFEDADVDRYTFNGEQQQVLVAPRELDVAGLPDNARSWTNLHLRYTHGYGVVLSPVSEATTGGQPQFAIAGLSGLENAAIPITQPQIYFGTTDPDLRCRQQPGHGIHRRKPGGRSVFGDRVRCHSARRHVHPDHVLAGARGSEPRDQRRDHQRIPADDPS